MNRTVFVRRTLSAVLVLAFVLALGVPFAAAQDGEGRVVTDFLGREVTITAPPERVVGLSASITEMLYAAGVTPVGVTEGIEFPEAAAELPTFGSGYQLDLEALAALEPDLIIANAQLQAQLVGQLESIAPTVFVMTLTAADVPANIRTIGHVTWQDTTAEYVAEAQEGLLDFVELTAPEEGPSILIIVGTLPIGILGLLFKDVIEGSLRNLYLTAAMLILFAVFLAFADRSGQSEFEQYRCEPVHARRCGRPCRPDHMPGSRRCRTDIVEKIVFERNRQRLSFFQCRHEAQMGRISGGINNA